MYQISLRDKWMQLQLISTCHEGIQKQEMLKDGSTKKSKSNFSFFVKNIKDSAYKPDL